MNVLVTGFPGTGKSTIAQILKKRGYTAYDPQKMQSYMHLEDRATGKHIRMPENAPRGWFDTQGAYDWNTGEVQKLLGRYEEVYICSLAHNMHELFNQFDYIFVLSADDFILQQRLEMRGSGLGSTPAQMADILTLHRNFEEGLINKGAIKVDIQQSALDCVNFVLETVHSGYAKKLA